MDLIIYHNGCPDGWTAAYIAKKRYPEAALMPRDHGLEPPYEEITGKDVLIVDFSFRTREQNIKASELAKSFRILDHHKTAEAELAGLDFATFDMTRSGAGLAWDYLFGKDASSEQFAERLNNPLRPWWVSYIEDQDLWRWALPDSKFVGQYLKVLPRTVESWDAMAKHDTPETAALAGLGIERGTSYYVREIVGTRQLGIIEGLTVGVVNAPYVNCSEVGAELAKESEVGLSYFERGDGIIQFSLRSVGDVDVSAIAKRHGGGGHKNAAGFQLPIYDARIFIDTMLNRVVMKAQTLQVGGRCVS